MEAVAVLASLQACCSSKTSHLVSQAAAFFINPVFWFNKISANNEKSMGCGLGILGKIRKASYSCIFHSDVLRSSYDYLT